MAAAPGPRPPLPCDFCGARIAPFGTAPPPAAGIAVRRPIWTCAACRPKAEARRAALIAAHDPLAKTRAARAPIPTPPPPGQKSLF